MKSLLAATAILALSVSSAAACGWMKNETASLAELDVERTGEQSVAKTDASNVETTAKTGPADTGDIGVQIAETPKRGDTAEK